LLSEAQREHFKQLLETRIAEVDHAVAAAEQEAREGATKHADAADQAASEYERQALVHKAATSRQMLKNLTQALERMRQGELSASAPNAAAT
jgi:RNA polymerase-binding transcription factor DksA